MASRTACCNICPAEGPPFAAPWDEVGVALMAQHVLSAHGIETNALNWEKEE